MAVMAIAARAPTMLLIEIMTRGSWILERLARSRTWSTKAESRSNPGRKLGSANERPGLIFKPNLVVLEVAA